MIFILTAHSVDCTAYQELGGPVVHVTLQCNLSEMVNAIERTCSSEEIVKAFSAIKKGEEPNGDAVISPQVVDWHGQGPKGSK